MKLVSALLVVAVVVFQGGCNGDKHDSIGGVPNSSPQTGDGSGSPHQNPEQMIERNAPSESIFHQKYESAELICRLWTITNTNIYDPSLPSDSFSINLLKPTTTNEHKLVSFNGAYSLKTQIKVQSIKFQKKNDFPFEDKIYELKNTPVISVSATASEKYDNKNDSGTIAESQVEISEGIDEGILRVSSGFNNDYESFVQCSVSTRLKPTYSDDFKVLKEMPSFLPGF